jgi:acyl phosphate:glycerol-3-phosphate acyltransferase
MSTLFANSVLISSVVGYLLGSIPFGYLLVRIFRGEDVRQSGSGNIGATNVARKSPGLGIVTLLFDALKGTCAVAFAYLVFIKTTHSYFDVRLYPMMSAAAVFSVLGHMFPVWLRFRGGKGVATSLGAFAPLAPHAILGAFVVFVLVALLSRYVSLGSIVAAASFPLLAWLSFRSSYVTPSLMILPMVVVSILIIAKHHQNIRRLLAGTENRFGSKGPAQSETSSETRPEKR